MTIIPLAIINCAVVELLLQVFALVYVSYGEQHCITTLYCTCVCFLWRTTLLQQPLCSRHRPDVNIVPYNHRAVIGSAEVEVGSSCQLFRNAQ